MKKPRIAYFGHHGTTRLQLKIHQQLQRTADIFPDPFFLTFNSYWRRRIYAAFPGALVNLLPTMTEWKKHSYISQKKAKALPGWEKDLQRAWKLDKILRHKPLGQVESLWALTVERCEKFLKEARPDYVISEIIQSLPCYALYRACQRKNIPFIQMAGSRLPERFEFFLTEDGIPYGLDKPSEPKASSLAWAKDYIASIQQRSYAGPAYMKSNTTAPKFITWQGFLRAVRYVTEQIQGGLQEPTGQRFWHFFSAKLRSWRVQRNNTSFEIFKNLDAVKTVTGPKVLFPLHVTPEASTDLWAPRYNNMLETASLLIKNLPKGWTLIMKEHPSTTFLQRDPKELKALQQLPQSLLVSPSIPNDDLLKECQATIVINGTFTLEAMIKGYVPITLAKPFYDLSGNTIPCEKLENLGLCLQKARETKPDESRTLSFVATYLEITDPGWPHNPDITRGHLTEDNIAKIAESIRKRFLSVQADADIIMNAQEAPFA